MFRGGNKFMYNEIFVFESYKISIDLCIIKDTNSFLFFSNWHIAAVCIPCDDNGIMEQI